MFCYIEIYYLYISKHSFSSFIWDSLSINVDDYMKCNNFHFWTSAGIGAKPAHQDLSINQGHMGSRSNWQGQSLEVRVTGPGAYHVQNIAVMRH